MMLTITFKVFLDGLGDSYDRSKKRFMNLEKKLNSNDAFATKYNKLNCTIILCLMPPWPLRLKS